MHIGLIIYGSLDTVSGGYLYDRKLVQYLRGQGDTVEIISLPWRNYAAHLIDNFRFRLPFSSATPALAPPDTVRQDWAESPCGARVATYGKQAPTTQSFDIMIQDELNHPSLIGANQGKHPYPIVSLVHHLRCSELRPKWQNDLYRVIEKKYLQSVDGFIFNSRTTQGVVNGLIGPGKPSLVAYPPTDRFGEAISEKEIRERANSSELRILFLGNVIYRKGLHILLEALNKVPRENISLYRLDVVGGLTAEPGYANEVQRYVNTHGLSSIVKFRGTLDNQPLIERYRQAHLMVVPSSYEGFGIVYLEGMGFGLPAIGTTSGAASEIIRDGVDGFMIESGDARGLADRLRSLDEERDVLVRMSLAARARYLRQPKWGETVRQIREFLLKQIKAFSV